MTCPGMHKLASLIFQKENLSNTFLFILHYNFKHEF